MLGVAARDTDNASREMVSLASLIVELSMMMMMMMMMNDEDEGMIQE